MATLALSRTELRKELGFEAGWGPEDDWDEDQVAAIDTAVRGGLRRFMLGTLIPGTRKTHEWSFLRQVHAFSTIADRDAYDLPKEFGSPDGPMLFDETNTAYTPVPVVNIAMVQEKLSLTPQQTGVPKLAAVRHKRGQGQGDQLQELVVWPTPDAAYSMRLGYHVLPDMMDEVVMKAMGGAAHARTLLFACLAELSRRVHSMQDYDADYEQALLASVSFDNRMLGSSLGYNGDGSSDFPSAVQQPSYYVRFNGVLYEN